MPLTAIAPMDPDASWDENLPPHVKVVRLPDSMYNAIFGGPFPEADEVLALVGLTRAECGRFRDAWIERAGVHGFRAVVYTRNGGKNRQREMPERLLTHQLLLADLDDTLDSTYCRMIFAIPPKHEAQEVARRLVRDPIDTSARWATLPPEEGSRRMMALANDNPAWRDAMAAIVGR